MMKKIMAFLLSSIVIFSGVVVAGMEPENNVLHLNINIEEPAPELSVSTNVEVSDELNLAYSTSIGILYNSFKTLFDDNFIDELIAEAFVPSGSELESKYRQILGDEVTHTLWNNAVCFAEKEQDTYVPVSEFDYGKTYTVFVVAIDSLAATQLYYPQLINEFKTEANTIPSFKAYNDATTQYYEEYVYHYSDEEVAERQAERDCAYNVWKADTEGQAAYAALYAEFDSKVDAAKKAADEYSGVSCTINGHEAECVVEDGYVYSCEFTLEGGYTATFVDENGETIEEVPYTVKTESIDEPAVPPKEGYAGVWEEYTLEIGGITVNPVYTPIEYNARFVAENGRVVKVVPYTVETERIDEPSVPKKEGYTGVWKEYTLAIGGITVNPVYTAIEYKARFVDENGKAVKVVPYTVKTESINEPSVPKKEGYTGVWEEYTLEIGGITVNPVYTVNEYKAIFVVDGEEQAIRFKYGEPINAPAFDAKPGYKLVWSSDVPATMPGKDITINGSYVCISNVSILKNPGKKIIDYGCNLQLYADTSNLPEGAKLVWNMNGKAFEGKEFNTGSLKEGATVTLKLVDKNNKVIKDAKGKEIKDTEEISINSGLFKIIIWFFKSLFKIDMTIYQK